MNAPVPSAGWYPDPESPARLRYWDGAHWTSHVQDPVPAESSAPHPQGPAKRKRRTWLIVVSAAAVVVLGIAAVGIWGVTQFAPGIPAGARGGAQVQLSESTFYQNNLEWIRSEVTTPRDPLASNALIGGKRYSPGYDVASQQFLEGVLADLEDEGTTEFDSLDEAESYAYEELTTRVADAVAAVADGGTGSELATTPFPQDAKIVSVEQQIAAAEISPSADGRYWEAAERLAALVGSRLTTDETAAGCAAEDRKDVLAYVCLGTENGWELITYTPLGMGEVSTPAFVDTVKHEIAHKLIHVQCGNPELAKWQTAYGEGVTNSYAVLYLGANAEELSDDGEYAMNAVTDAKARAIHENDLACYDEEALPAG